MCQDCQICQKLFSLRVKERAQAEQSNAKCCCVDRERLSFCESAGNLSELSKPLSAET